MACEHLYPHACGGRNLPTFTDNGCPDCDRPPYYKCGENELATPEVCICDTTHTTDIKPYAPN